MYTYTNMVLLLSQDPPGHAALRRPGVRRLGRLERLRRSKRELRAAGAARCGAAGQRGGDLAVSARGFSICGIYHQ